MKGNLDFSTMGILMCTACRYHEYIQEIWVNSLRFLKLRTVLSAKHARVFHECDLASIFALCVLSWIRLQAQCNLNTRTQRYNLFSWHVLELGNSDLSFIYVCLFMLDIWHFSSWLPTRMFFWSHLIPSPTLLTIEKEIPVPKQPFLFPGSVRCWDHVGI